jgi:hypothetical protein
MNNIGISLGWNCHSAIWSVNNNIRKHKATGYNTCPFDIMVTNYKGLINCLNDDFKFLYNENYLELIKETKENEYSIYNTKYNFIFNHESPGHADLYISEKWQEGINHFTNNNFKNLKDRYSKRIDNFRSYLSDPNNYITFVITSFEKTDDDILDLKLAIEKHYPTLKYKIIILNEPNGKEYYLRHLRIMKYTDEDYEVQKLL